MTDDEFYTIKRVTVPEAEDIFKNKREREEFLGKMSKFNLNK